MKQTILIQFAGQTLEIAASDARHLAEAVNEATAQGEACRQITGGQLTLTTRGGRQGETFTATAHRMTDC
jgi:hypothetical protein